MAGIGFELKRLFRRKGLFATMRAYGYAGIVCTGPMLLGVLLQVGILVLCGLWGVGRANQDLLVCMVTYTLLASLTLTSFFSMPVTRFLADMLFAEREDEILPSFWGSNAIMLVAGTVLYGVFLLFSGATLLQGLLCLWLFNIMIVNWNGMSYLTAIKDYRGILCSFAAAIGVACLCALAALALRLPPVEGLLASIALGYGVMLAWDVVLLYRYFPQSDRSPWLFLQWLDEFMPLALTGLFTNLGLFAHLVIIWAGPIGVQVKGLFYGAPYHDVPALLAFLTILVTTVNFVVSVEVNFYPRYRDYYSLFNDGGGHLARDYGALGPAAGLQQPDARLFPYAVRGLWPVCRGQYGDAHLVVLYRLQGRRSGLGAVRGRGRVGNDRVAVLAAAVLRLWLFAGCSGVFCCGADAARHLYCQLAVSYPESAAHRGDRQDRSFYAAGSLARPC